MFEHKKKTNKIWLNRFLHLQTIKVYNIIVMLNSFGQKKNNNNIKCENSLDSNKSSTFISCENVNWKNKIKKLKSNYNIFENTFIKHKLTISIF